MRNVALSIWCPVTLSLLQDLESLDNSVGIKPSYGLDDLGSRVRFPAGAGNFSVHHRVQDGSGAHPASCPVGTGGFFRRGKLPRA
jgi:hypothetical protein